MLLTEGLIVRRVAGIELCMVDDLRLCRAFSEGFCLSPSVGLKWLGKQPYLSVRK